MDSKFSTRIKDVLTYSREEAIRLGNDHICTEHLFLGILRDGEGIAHAAVIGARLKEGPRAVVSQDRVNERDGQARVGRIRD